MSFGIYIHIPFCTTRCNYCHFVIRPWKARSAERYRRAVVREIGAFFAREHPAGEADSIYFGGGTPSLVPVEHIEEILGTCRKCFPISGDCEISLESNPGTLSPEKAAAYRDLGITRVSIGAQSFDAGELAAIGRDHSGEQIDDSVRLLRGAGIDNLNLDLMLGLPGQAEDSWTADLGRTGALAPSHVSVYMLDLDSGSPLYYHVAKGSCTLPEDDRVSDWYLQARLYLCERGYQQYEISNFALRGYECRHNLKYWLRRPVLGFGVGSHSYDGTSRYASYSSMSAYLEAVEAGCSPIEWRAPVSEEQALEETLFLGLRLNRGLDWQRLRDEFNSPRLDRYEDSMKEMSQNGLLEWQDSVVRLTPSGMLLSNDVFSRFV